MLRSVRWTALVLLVGLACGGCKPRRTPVTVFVAASLAQALGQLEEAFEESHPRLDLVMEISGSQTACRKVAELNRPADVVLVADHRVIDRILRPKHATAVIRFAANAVTLGHMEHSRHTEQITADNWAEVLQRDGVRIGLVNPDLAPIGYRTLLVWQLAELKGKNDLTGALRARVAAEHVAPHESELIQLLQSRAVDYAFVYQSTAEDQNIKTVPLSDAINLGDPARAESYSRATTTVRMRSRGKPTTLRGAPVVYGAAIPTTAPNPAGADALVQLLLSEEGRRTLARRGFRPITPARCAPCKGLPPAVKVLTRPVQTSR